MDGSRRAFVVPSEANLRRSRASTRRARRATTAEKAFRARVDADPELKKLAGGAWDALADAKHFWRGLQPSYLLLEAGHGFDSELFATRVPATTR